MGIETGKLTMKIFISWSGSLSKEIGQILREWLPVTLQAVKPYFTPSDVEKGARWLTEISTELESSSVAILCLTRESLDSSWVIFEAGALSKSVQSSRICPLLFGITPSDLPGPLGQFQATVFAREEILKMMRTINGAMKEGALNDPVLDKVFEMWWPDLEQKINAAITRHTSVKKTPVKSDGEMLGELLETTRLIARQNASVPTLRIAQRSPIGSWTRGTLPSPSASSYGELVMVTDGLDGPTLCFSDGTSWKAVEGYTIDATTPARR